MDTQLPFPSMNQVATKKNMVSLHDVTVDFARIRALDNVQLTLHTQDVLFITGASGAGQTTLLNVLAGNVSPSQGRVQFKSRGRFDDKPFVAEVFQDLKLFPQRTCEENMLIAYDPAVHQSEEEFRQEEAESVQQVPGLSAPSRLSWWVHEGPGAVRQE